MNAIAISRAVLQLRLRWQRNSAVARLAWALAVLVLLLTVGVMPWVESRLDEAQSRLRETRQAVARASMTAPQVVERPDDRRLAEWHERLGHLHRTTDYIGRIYAVAARQELVIDQADYESTTDSATGLVTYRLRFQSEASYAALRQFCDEVLRRFPFISLDEFALDRESVESDTLHAKLGFTLHLMARPR
jgi:hypothetical protein